MCPGAKKKMNLAETCNRPNCMNAAAPKMGPDGAVKAGKYYKICTLHRQQAKRTHATMSRETTRVSKATSVTKKVSDVVIWRSKAQDGNTKEVERQRVFEKTFTQTDMLEKIVEQFGTDVASRRLAQDEHAFTEQLLGSFGRLEDLQDNDMLTPDIMQCTSPVVDAVASALVALSRLCTPPLPACLDLATARRGLIERTKKFGPVHFLTFVYNVALTGLTANREKSAVPSVLAGIVPNTGVCGEDEECEFALRVILELEAGQEPVALRELLVANQLLVRMVQASQGTLKNFASGIISLRRDARRRAPEVPKMSTFSTNMVLSDLWGTLQHGKWRRCENLLVYRVVFDTKTETVQLSDAVAAWILGQLQQPKELVVAPRSEGLRADLDGNLFTEPTHNTFRFVDRYFKIPFLKQHHGSLSPVWDAYMRHCEDEKKAELAFEQTRCLEEIRSKNLADAMIGRWNKLKNDKLGPTLARFEADYAKAM